MDVNLQFNFQMRAFHSNQNGLFFTHPVYVYCPSFLFSFENETFSFEQDITAV